MERCPNCGASIRTGARFCTACGFRLEPAAIASPTTDQAIPPSATEDGIPTANASGGTMSPEPDSYPDGSGAGGQGDPDPSVNVRDTSLRSERDDASAQDEREGDENTSTAVDELDESLLATDDAALSADDGGLAAASGTESRDDVGSSVAASGSGDALENQTGGESAPSDNWWATLGEDEADTAAGSRDDVVIGSTVVRESSWPSNPAEPARFTPILATDVPAQQVHDASAADAVQSPSESAGVNGSEQSNGEPSPTEAGRDSDWEPWGTGTEIAGRVPDQGAFAYFPDDRQGIGSDPDGSQAEASAGHEDPIQRARMLLAQLHSTLDTLEAAPTEPKEEELDAQSKAQGDAVAEASQLLDAFDQALVDDDRLNELQRLTTELEGRDYDIRALQRFAQERELILELAMSYRQQQDLLDQLRQVLSHTLGDE